VAGWYVARDGQAVGPFTIGQLAAQVRRGELPPDGFVWAEGTDSWRLAGSVEALFGERRAVPDFSDPRPAQRTRPLAPTSGHDKVGNVPKAVDAAHAQHGRRNPVVMGCILAALVIGVAGTVAALALYSRVETVVRYHGFKPAVAQGREVDAGVARAMKEAEGAGFVSEVRFQGMRWSSMGIGRTWHVVYETSLRSRQRPSFAITRTIDISSDFGQPMDGYAMAVFVWEDYQAIKVLNQMHSAQRAGFIDLFETLTSSPTEEYASLQKLDEADASHWNGRHPSLSAIRARAAASGETDATWVLRTADPNSEYYKPYRVLYHDPTDGWELREESIR